MAKKPEPPKAVTWDVYRAAHKPKIVGSVRRMLKLLGRSRHGANEELLVHRYGFRRPTIVSLVSAGLAIAEREVVKAGGKPIEVVRVRITAAGGRWSRGER
jgi:hypothetical protein